MLSKGGISGSAQGKISLSLSLSLFHVLCVSPFRRASTLFLPCASTHRTHARTRSLYLSHVPALSFTRASALSLSLSIGAGTLSLRAIQPPFLRDEGGRREPTERENRSSTMSYPNPNPSASPGVHTRPSGTHFPRSGSWVTATARSVLAVNRTQGFNTGVRYYRGKRYKTPPLLRDN